MDQHDRKLFRAEDIQQGTGPADDSVDGMEEVRFGDTSLQVDHAARRAWVQRGKGHPCSSFNIKCAVEMKNSEAQSSTSRVSSASAR